MPDLDMLDRPFREAATDLDDFPDTAAAPSAPKDMRTDADWDASARQILAERDAFTGPVDAARVSDGSVLAIIERLRAEVQAYRADDPPGS